MSREFAAQVLARFDELDERRFSAPDRASEKEIEEGDEELRELTEEIIKLENRPDPLNMLRPTFVDGLPQEGKYYLRVKGWSAEYRLDYDRGLIVPLTCVPYSERAT